MKLFLTVRISHDHSSLPRCFESIKENIDLFDGIFIAALMHPDGSKTVIPPELESSSLVHTVHLDQDLSYSEHSRQLDRWVDSFNLDGHIFRLECDAVLLRQGISELKKMDFSETDAAVGTFRFFAPDNSRREMTVCEFRQFGDSPLTREQWNFFQGQHSFTLVPSGIVIPAKLLRCKTSIWHHLPSPWRMAECQLNSPAISRVFQPKQPVVRAPLPGCGNEIGLTDTQKQFSDLLYFLMVFSLQKRFWDRIFTARMLLYVIFETRSRKNWNYIKAQLQLLRSAPCYWQSLKIVFYFSIISFKKICNICKKLCHSGEQKW